MITVADAQLNVVNVKCEMRLSHQSDCSLLDILIFSNIVAPSLYSELELLRALVHFGGQVQSHRNKPGDTK